MKSFLYTPGLKDILVVQSLFLCFSVLFGVYTQKWTFTISMLFFAITLEHYLVGLDHLPINRKLYIRNHMVLQGVFFCAIIFAYNRVDHTWVNTTPGDNIYMDYQTGRARLQPPIYLLEFAFEDSVPSITYMGESFQPTTTPLLGNIVYYNPYEIHPSVSLTMQSYQFQKLVKDAYQIDRSLPQILDFVRPLLTSYPDFPHDWAFEKSASGLKNMGAHWRLPTAQRWAVCLLFGIFYFGLITYVYHIKARKGFLSAKDYFLKFVPVIIAMAVIAATISNWIPSYLVFFKCLDRFVHFWYLSIPAWIGVMVLIQRYLETQFSAIRPNKDPF